MSAPDANGWFDISSAPKDGTAIWVWHDGEAFLGLCEPPNGHWRTTDTWHLKACVERVSDGLDKIFGCFVRGPEPTHWQPLPAPPASIDLSHSHGAVTA
jgi:hypothetical protein